MITWNLRKMSLQTFKSSGTHKEQISTVSLHTNLIDLRIYLENGAYILVLEMLFTDPAIRGGSCLWILAILEAEIRRITFWDQRRENTLWEPISKITPKWTGVVVQAEEHLLCKYESLNSNTIHKKKIQKKLIESSKHLTMWGKCTQNRTYKLHYYLLFVILNNAFQGTWKSIPFSSSPKLESFKETSQHSKAFCENHYVT
jgi:hypothetical protein